ncbi:MAG: hypothetical protein Q9227_004774 [Pyrenula ochraceoflavens]
MKERQSSSVATAILRTTQASARSRTPLEHRTSSPLKRLPIRHLLRNIILSAFLTKHFLFKPGFAALKYIANSRSRFLNPDSNILLRAAINPIYNQFCAGVNEKEIRYTIAKIRDLGFSGVALINNREIQIARDAKPIGAQRTRVAEIEEWRNGTLRSLDMIDSRHFLGMKFTGAGQEVTEALIAGRAPPPAFASAMQVICQKAKEKGCRLWVDAEQQAVQPTIQQWVIPLMRQYNDGSNLVIYTTIQAYLKECRQNLKSILDLSQREGWNLGIKLVRGAYIACETRNKIHESKAETDACYDGIVRDLLSGNLEDEFAKKDSPPRRLELFLAGHNSESVRKALALAQELSDKCQLKISPEFGQLQGMADDIGGEIIDFADSVRNDEGASTSSLPSLDSDGRVGDGRRRQIFVPKVYKALHWGSVHESMQYLVRRAVENSAAVDRMEESAVASKKELWNRVKLRFLGV